VEPLEQSECQWFAEKSGKSLVDVKSGGKNGVEQVITRISDQMN
jgi:hypothetical protein